GETTGTEPGRRRRGDATDSCARPDGDEMQRLSGMDASFLYMETPTRHMHVCGVLMLDPATMSGGYSFNSIRQLIASRIHLMPQLRRRAVAVPLGVDHPVWIEDPEFDI